MDGGQLLDPEAAGIYLGGTKPIKKETLAKWRCVGRQNGPTPKFVRFSRMIRYRREDLDAWLAQGAAFGSTSEYPAIEPHDAPPIKRNVAA